MSTIHETLKQLAICNDNARSISPAELADRLARITADLYRIADGEHLDEDDMAPQAWPKKCGCGMCFMDPSIYRASTKLIGYAGAFKNSEGIAAIELRNCACGSTLATEVNLERPTPVNR